MTDKSIQKIKQSDASDVVKIKTDSSTSTYHIKDGPIEKFTKVSLFCQKFGKYFELKLHVLHFILLRMAWH